MGRVERPLGRLTSDRMRMRCGLRMRPMVRSRSRSRSEGRVYELHMPPGSRADLVDACAHSIDRFIAFRKRSAFVLISSTHGYYDTDHRSIPSINTPATGRGPKVQGGRGDGRKQPVAAAAAGGAAGERGEPRAQGPLMPNTMPSPIESPPPNTDLSPRSSPPAHDDGRRWRST